MSRTAKQIEREPVAYSVNKKIRAAQRGLDRWILRMCKLDGGYYPRGGDRPTYNALERLEAAGKIWFDRDRRAYVLGGTKPRLVNAIKVRAGNWISIKGRLWYVKHNRTVQGGVAGDVSMYRGWFRRLTLLPHRGMRRSERVVRDTDKLCVVSVH